MQCELIVIPILTIFSADLMFSNEMDAFPLKRISSFHSLFQEIKSELDGDEVGKENVVVNDAANSPSFLPTVSPTYDYDQNYGQANSYVLDAFFSHSPSCSGDSSGVMVGLDTCYLGYVNNKMVSLKYSQVHSASDSLLNYSRTVYQDQYCYAGKN